LRRVPSSSRLYQDGRRTAAVLEELARVSAAAGTAGRRAAVRAASAVVQATRAQRERLGVRHLSARRSLNANEIGLRLRVGKALNAYVDAVGRRP